MKWLDKLLHKYTLRLYDAHFEEVVDYMTKYYLNIPDWPIFGKIAGGTLRFHHFHQGEPETDAFHDHEYHFYTFPLAPYQEGVLNSATGQIDKGVVPAFRVTYREASMRHVVYGRWHDAGQYGEGVVNWYKPLWTCVIGLKRFRQFSIVRFYHPAGLDYEGFVAEYPDDDPRPYWIDHEFDPVAERESGVMKPLFPKAFAKLSPNDQSEILRTGRIARGLEEADEEA